jgi:hypothetical protein
MKSPDDKINDELRDALRRRFDDFELTPGPAVKNSIFAKLKTWQLDQAFQRTWITCLLFAILFTAALFYSSTRDSVGKGISVVNKKKIELAVSAKSTVEKVGNKPSGFKKKVLNTRNSEGNIPDIKKNAAGIIAGNVKTLPMTEVKNVTKVALTPLNSLPESNLYSQSESKIIPTTESQKEILIAPDEPREKVEFGDIDYLSNRQANLEHSGLTISDSISYYSKAAGKPQKALGGLTLLLGVTPVKTFQVLNIISNPGLMYRNFEFPGSASIETLGYKLSGGLEKRGLQMLLSYGQYKQAVRYEAAGNEFEVVPNGSSAEVKRKFKSIHSEQTLKLIGLGLRKQFVPRAPAFRDFYAVGGAEFTREISQGKNMVWVNAGIGRQVGIGRNTALQIGPYVEYGFTRLMNAEGSFQVQPYQVGLSIILRNKLTR